MIHHQVSYCGSVLYINFNLSFRHLEMLRRQGMTTAVDLASTLRSASVRMIPSAGQTCEHTCLKSHGEQRTLQFMCVCIWSLHKRLLSSYMMKLHNTIINIWQICCQNRAAWIIICCSSLVPNSIGLQYAFEEWLGKSRHVAQALAGKPG